MPANRLALATNSHLKEKPMETQDIEQHPKERKPIPPMQEPIMFSETEYYEIFDSLNHTFTRMVEVGQTEVEIQNESIDATFRAIAKLGTYFGYGKRPPWIDAKMLQLIEATKKPKRLTKEQEKELGL